MPRNVVQKREGDMLWLGIRLTEPLDQDMLSASQENYTLATAGGRVKDFTHPDTGEPVRFTVSAFTKNSDYIMSDTVKEAKIARYAARLGLKPA